MPNKSLEEFRGVGEPVPSSIHEKRKWRTIGPMERSSYIQFDTASIDVFPEIDPKDGEYEIRQTVCSPDWYCQIASSIGRSKSNWLTWMFFNVGR